MDVCLFFFSLFLFYIITIIILNIINFFLCFVVRPSRMEIAK